MRRIVCGLGLVLGVTMLAGAQTATVPDGIPRALAQERAARVSDLHYKLSFDLRPHAATTEATEEIRFQLRDASTPLLLDFRDGEMAELRVNGLTVAAQIAHGHLVLPAGALRTGENRVDAKFTANIGVAGKAITRFEDKDDGNEYLYTLFVPMDAEMAFPCFDQPDLKGRFTLTVTAPNAWNVIANTSPESKFASGGMHTTAFAETEPIPTYLFAFAAGPFVNVHPQAGMPNVWVRKSQVKKAVDAVPAVQEAAAQGMEYLGKYFNEPFPFPKYEMVLIPGFAYGGMEHAGATFLREESVIFRSAPTAINRLNRDVVVLHELTHQWFGDATTMRWFDDLWLKEGFAQYMAYKTLAALHPDEPIWQRFYQSIKPLAYGIDETEGTTPIYQDIPNLNVAKSAYGAIVYEKAPGVLRQLNYVLGDEAFQRGLQIYLAQHKYGNATWSDLIGAFQTASGRDLTSWADMWIRHRGMPRVDTQWSCDGGRLSTLRLTQTPVLGGDDVWPIATEVALGYAGGSVKTLRADLTGKSADVPLGAGGQACPAWVFANNDDHAYGLFLLDAKSQAAVIQQVAATPDLFRRTLLWGALWDAVREAQLDPAEYADHALKALPQERDELLAASLLGRTQTAVHHYVSAAAQKELLTRGATLAVDRMQHEEDHDLRIVWFRSLGGFGAQGLGQAAMKQLLSEQLTIPGVELRQQDRWSLVTALIAYGDPQANEYFDAEQKRDPSGDGKKFAYVAQAARPDAATKAHYFDDYLHNPQQQEDWIASSLGAFNYWNQAEMTAPYLQPALAALEQIKRERKIFFLVGWLDAFMDGQESKASLDVVEQYLATAHPDPDLRLKILQSMDELQRTVRIR
ncbi:MAG TPA: M1 family aminopeptidase, partial [Acidobacteriaceae bacterium]|nr:M1 family aminopeptidase [Acidobacteriaceae bacterium]